ATYAMRDCLEIMQGMQIPVEQIRVSGGGARSGFWRQLQANIYGHSVVTINAEEGPAFGVALLAAVGTGAYRSVEEACRATIRVVGETAVEPAAAACYHQAYPIQQQLYRSLRQDYQAIARFVASQH
ncbi:MAG: xylulokinase, partial [Planctomycetaceae bacterium]|nr:xylulokinase [Planctomycetaceae bacterium]